MNDKPVTNGHEAAIIDSTTDEQISDLTTAGAEASFGCSGHPPAGSSRQSSLTPQDSQSLSASGNQVMSSGANISSTTQSDTSSTNSGHRAVATAATSLIQPVNLVGTTPHFSTLPPRPSVGPFGTGFVSAPQPFGFQGQHSGFDNPFGRGWQLYGLPEAQAHVEAERKKIMETFQDRFPTPSGRSTQQQRGSVAASDTKPDLRNSQCCSSPDIQRGRPVGLIWCQKCRWVVHEDSNGSGTASSSTSSEALVQCCSDPSPLDVGEEDGTTNIVCLNCGKAHDAADVFASSFRPVSTDAMDQYIANKVQYDLDPNRIRMVKHPRDDAEFHHIGHSIGPAQFRKLSVPPAYGEALFIQCYDAEKSLCPSPSFPKFMELPRELRERVYGYALKSDKSIAPHLCDEGRPAREGKSDYGKAIRFHDENQTTHNATCKLLAITRVSKQVHQESLPIFYSVNTFETTGDTPIYFSRLQQLDRFHMIRHVDLWVRFWKNEQYSQKLLRMLLQNFEDQKAFEMNHMEAARNKRSNESKAMTAAENADAKGLLPTVLKDSEDTKFYTDDLAILKSHPLHVIGGLEANFLVLRMLSAQFQDDDEYNRLLVVHVPTTALFTDYDSLKYFPLVCEGLGIQLKLISGRDVEMYGSSFRLSWAQKYQKKDFTASTTAKDWNEVEALTSRVQALYPDIEDLPRPAKWTYYRRLCKQNEIEWFSIETTGGGIR